MYLDKPMRNHTLMQTITRANRVFPGKHRGVIVDYANVFASLEKALAIYGAGKDGKSPVKDKQQLLEVDGPLTLPRHHPLASSRRRRDPACREKVLLAYQYRCGVCGHDLRLGMLI